MTYPEYGVFAYGTSEYPLTPSTSNSSLFDADKPIYYLLDYCEGMLSYYMGDRFIAESARAGRADLTNVVTYKLPYNPVPYLTDTTIQFPLLAMWRGDGQMKLMESISYYRVVTQIHLLWLLPPLTAAEREIFQPMLTAAMSILKDRNESGLDPNYLSGTNIGQLAGYEALNCLSYEISDFPGVKSELPFVSLYMGFELWEIPQPYAGAFGPVTGLDGYVNIDTNPVLDDFVVINTDEQPINPEGDQ